jgi:hypothetical protein
MRSIKTSIAVLVGGRLRDYTVGLHSEPKPKHLKFLYVDKQFPDGDSSNPAQTAGRP